MKTVILAGGTGTRLWPMSRKKKPKQFQNLIGKKSMLRQTIERLSFQKPQDIYIATNSEFIDLVREQIKGLIPQKNIIIEPALRDTAPCIGLIAATLAQDDPDDVMAIIYADHLIQDTAELADKLKVAEHLARRDNTINIIEVKALSPNTNLGYVKIGPEIKTMDGIPVHSLESFVEKPDLKKAKRFIKSGNYLWNTGLFVWKISTILEKYRSFLPETHNLVKKITSFKKQNERSQALVDLYPLCEKISFDYGIMEKISPSEVRIIPAHLGWNDIGTWESIWQELRDRHPEGMVLQGNILHADCRDSLIYGHAKKPVVAIGVDDLIVVDTEDALLVCGKNQSTKLKIMIERLGLEFPEVL